MNKKISLVFFALVALVLFFQNCGNVRLNSGQTTLSSTCEPEQYIILRAFDSTNARLTFHLQESRDGSFHEYSGSVGWTINSVAVSSPTFTLPTTPNCSQQVTAVANFADTCGQAQDLREDFFDPRCVTPTPTPTPSLTPTPTPLPFTPPPPDTFDYEGHVTRQMMSSGEVMSLPLPTPAAGRSGFKITLGENPGSPQPVTIQVTVSKIRGYIDTTTPDGVNFCNLRSTNGAYNSVSIVTKPVSIFTNATATNQYGLCWAPESEGPWYYNVRWTFPTCGYGGGSVCGFSMQYNSESFLGE